MKRVIVMAVIAACVQTARLACGCNEGNRAIEQRRKMEPPREPTRVKLGPTRLQYFEGENSLVLYTEPARDREGFYYIVYVPTPERWARTMPEWARYRREEILADIKRLTKDERIKWVDQS